MVELFVMLSLSCALLLVIFGVITFKKDRKYREVPAVTPRWPFVGNALSLDMSSFHITLTNLAKEFGAIYRIKLYDEEIVVLNDYESIQDALVSRGNHVAGRPHMFRTSQENRNQNSIVWQTYTPKLKILRKQVLRSLKMYGDGLDKLEEKCIPEIDNMVGEIQETNGEPFDPWELSYDFVCNVMLMVLLGVRLHNSDPCFEQLKTINKLFNTTFGSGNGKRLDVIPWLRLFKNRDYANLQEALRLRDEFWDEHVSKAKLTDNDDTVIKSLFELVTDGNSSVEYDISETTVKECFTNLILAGTDTTATALACLMLILVQRPDIQDALHKQIDNSLGKSSKSPSLCDRTVLPYLEAVLLELLRYISHVPLAVPHCTICDTTIKGKRVPKNTTVYINLWASHHDEKDWVNPWTFDPTRFLDQNGKLLPPQHKQRRRLLAFGAGRRVCVGEVLAKNRLFLFAAALTQRFRFVPGDQQLPDMDPRTYSLGLVLHPQRFKLRALRRA